MLHHAFENFQGDVIDKVVQLNSEFYKLDLELDKTVIKDEVIKEAESVPAAVTHFPHLGNLYNNSTITKLIAIHIQSSRDYIQGGEFYFGKWTDPVRKDNYGRIQGSEQTAYPTWLNEQGTMFVVPALESIGNRLIVSGELSYKLYAFRGPNYK